MKHTNDNIKTAKAHAHKDSCGCGDEHSGISKYKIVSLSLALALFITGIALEYTVLKELVWYRLIFYIPAYFLAGGGVLLKACKNIGRGRVFDENFLMAIASIGAFFIFEFAESVAVMLFFEVGELCSDLAAGRAKKSIIKLMDLRPDYANIYKDGELTAIAPEEVKIGDEIVIKPGEKIPLDGVVVSGSSELNLSSLTGESIPKSVTKGDSVLSGSVNISGLLTVRAEKEFKNSTVSKIVELASAAADKKAKTEKFITKFAKYYTPAVVLAAIAIALLPPIILGFSVWQEWLYRALTFLVISCPCALVISIPLSFFGGIGRAAKRGVLVKAGEYLESLTKLDIVVLDKTGTVTKGIFEVTEVIASGGKTKEDVLRLAARAEQFSPHPIGKAICLAAGEGIDKSGVIDYTDIPGGGVIANVEADGEILVGSAGHLLSRGIEVSKTGMPDGTLAYVALNGLQIGCIAVSDAVKPESEDAIAALKNKGVRVVMLSGDHKNTVEAVAKEVGIDEYYGELLPQDKLEKIEELKKQKRKNGTLAFIGDGVNDAPALCAADVGFAMGGIGSDAAVETADIVLMHDGLNGVTDAVEAAKRTKAVAWQNIALTFIVKALFLILGAFGISTMYEAVFADVGVALIAVLNSLRIMRLPKNRSKNKISTFKHT